MADGPGTNWLDVLKAGFWPLLALLLVVMFWAPLSALVAGLEDVQSFKAGQIEVTFNARRANALAPPDPEVGEALQALSPRDRDALMSMGSPRRVTFCTPRGYERGRNSDSFRQDPSVNQLSASQVDSYIQLSSSYERMAALRLGNPRQNFPASIQLPAWCQGEYFYLETTPLGDRARNYLMGLMNSGIQISGAS